MRRLFVFESGWRLVPGGLLPEFNDLLAKPIEGTPQSQKLLRLLRHDFIELLGHSLLVHPFDFQLLNSSIRISQAIYLRKSVKWQPIYGSFGSANRYPIPRTVSIRSACGPIFFLNERI